MANETTINRRHSIIRPLSSLRHRFRESLSFPRPPSRANTHAVIVAQSIPQELLVIIIEALAAPFHLAAFAVGCLLSRYDREEFTRAMLNDARNSLLSTIRVCRSWNIAGTQILYSKPFLMSPSQVHLFSRSLKANPSLCSLVRQLFVLQPHQKSPLHLINRLAWINSRALGSEFASSLSACTALETLTFTHCSRRPTVYSSWGNNFVLRSGIGERLKELAIHGTTGLESKPLEILTPPQSFPCLEVLVLKAVTLRSDHRFPHFPKLRTLRIVLIPHAKGDKAPLKLGIYSSSFPSVRKLILQDTGASIDVDASILRNLWSLRLCGTSERGAYNTWVAQGLLDNVTHLDFHLKKLKPGRFAVTKYPPALKSLMLCVTFSQTRDVEAINAEALKDFQRTFLAATEGCTRLRSLYIHCQAIQTKDTSEYDAVMEKIRLDCDRGGVRLVEKGPLRTIPTPRNGDIYVLRIVENWPSM